MESQLTAQAQNAPDDVYISSAQLRAMFGGISHMTVSRWLADPRVGFPRPIKISSRNYWARRAVLEFIRRRNATY